MDMDKLKHVIQNIVSTAKPKRIVLFGSRAKGTNRPDSDWDFLIIKESDQPRYLRAAPIRRAIAGLLPAKDIVVYTPEEIAEWENVPNAFVTQILSEGKTLYEKNEG